MEKAAGRNSHRGELKEPFGRPRANDIVGKIMNTEQYNQAVAMIKGHPRGASIATSQKLIGPSNFGLTVQIGEKKSREKNIFRAFEGFTRWWNQF